MASSVKSKEAEESNSRSLAKATGIFAIGTFGSKILTLLIIPLCTHFISTGDMGIYDVVYTVVALLQPIAILAIPESLFRWIIDEDNCKKRVYSTWLVLFACLFIVFTVLFWAVWAFLRFGDAAITYALVAFSCLYQGFQFGTRGLHNNKLFAVSGVLYALVYCVAAFALVAVFQVGYRGLLYAMLGATIASSFLLLFSQKELRSFAFREFDWDSAKEMLRYSVFLLPNQISWWAMNWLARFVIVAFLGYSANGIFSVAMKFPSVLTMVSNVFIPAWQEQAVALFGSKGKDAYFSKVFNRYLVLLFSVLIPGLPLTKLFIDLLMDAAYSTSFDFVAMLYLGAAFNALSGFVGVLFLCSKDTKGAASSTLVGALVNAAATLVLVPIAGLMGAALGNMVGNAVVLAIRLLQTRKYCRLSLDWKRLVVLVLLVVGSSFFTMAMPAPWATVLFSLACGTLFVGINHGSVRALLLLLKKSN